MKKLIKNIEFKKNSKNKRYYFKYKSMYLGKRTNDYVLQFIINDKFFFTLYQGKERPKYRDLVLLYWLYLPVAFFSLALKTFILVLSVIFLLLSSWFVFEDAIKDDDKALSIHAIITYVIYFIGLFNVYDVITNILF